MDINQLKYLISIVDNNLNITQASQQLFISQPALSKVVLLFEKESKLQIFKRSRGRLTALTSDGEMIISCARRLVSDFDKLTSMIEVRSRMVNEEIVLGIPPLVITALFTEFLSEMRIKNPYLKINLVELGGKTLEEMVLNGQLDFSVLVAPEGFSDEDFEIKTLYVGNYSLFVSNKNPLVANKHITWSNLVNTDVALADESYKTYHLFVNYIQEKNIKLNSLITAYSWDYLFQTIRNSNRVTFLPEMTKGIFNMTGVKMLHFEKPMKWVVTFVYRKKPSYTNAEQNLIDFIQLFFSDHSRHKF